MELFMKSFQQLLTMMITALPVISVVLVVRLALSRAPKKYGYLLWIVNKWYQPQMDEEDTYFPNYSTRNGNGMPGDGILMYPGKKSIWPSIKLANCRDAEEDYEYLKIASELLGEAASDEVSKTLVKSLTDFTRDPATIRAARRRLADMIERKCKNRK